MRSAIMYASAAAGLFLIAGCTEKLAPVSGVVTMGGKPLEGVTVGFHPVEPGSGKGTPRQANGLTNKDGKYSVETVNDKGMAAGTYKVTLVKKVYPKGVTPPDAKTNMMEMMRVAHQMIDLIPKEYSTMATTPLSITVPSGGKSDAHFDVPGPAPEDAASAKAEK